MNTIKLNQAHICAITTKLKSISEEYFISREVKLFGFTISRSGPCMYQPRQRVKELPEHLYVEDGEVYHLPHIIFHMANGEYYKKYFEYTIQLQNFVQYNLKDIPWLEYDGIINTKSK